MSLSDKPQRTLLDKLRCPMNLGEQMESEKELARLESLAVPPVAAQGETPRTDGAAIPAERVMGLSANPPTIFGDYDSWVRADIARQLERELAELQTRFFSSDPAVAFPSSTEALYTKADAEAICELAVAAFAATAIGTIRRIGVKSGIPETVYGAMCHEIHYAPTPLVPIK